MTSSTSNYGTLPEFLADRAGPANAEQSEAVAHEFYHIMLQMVLSGDTGFTLRSHQTFPLLTAPEQLTLLKMHDWALAFNRWVSELDESELRALVTTKFMWS